jgi:hypothetical protein
MAIEQFYIDREGKTDGPYSFAELVALRNRGEISDQALVSAEGWERWVPLSEVFASPADQDKPSERDAAFLTDNPDYVAFIKQKTDAILAGKLDIHTAILYLDQFLETIEYFPAVEDIDTIYDLSSFETRKLILCTVVETSQGYYQYMAGMTGTAPEAYPAWRVITARQAVVPRDWVERWTVSCRAAHDEVALALYRKTGQMTALKGSGVWEQLGNPGHWPDALGNP